MRVSKILTWAGGLLGAALAGVVVAPQALAFPYVENFGPTSVYAEQPIDAARMSQLLADVDRKLRTSAIDDGDRKFRVFLTNGGWRWNLLALKSRDGFGLTRPLSDRVSRAIIINRSDPVQNRITLDRKIGGTRTLSSVIAHEATHMLVRRTLGLIDGVLLPTWKSEGYADHVAAESSLSDADWAKLKASGVNHPAMPYYEGRKRVEAALAENGNDVMRFLAE